MSASLCLLDVNSPCLNQLSLLVEGQLDRIKSVKQSQISCNFIVRLLLKLLDHARVLVEAEPLVFHAVAEANAH